jgi:hypothetical protein
VFKTQYIIKVQSHIGVHTATNINMTNNNKPTTEQSSPRAESKQDSLPVNEQEPPSPPVDKQGWQLPNQGRWCVIECGRQRARESRGKHTLEQRAARRSRTAEGSARGRRAHGRRAARGSRRQRAREKSAQEEGSTRGNFSFLRASARARAGFPPSVGTLFSSQRARSV